jgi:membrane associated rhomboid family serine protease
MPGLIAITSLSQATAKAPILRSMNAPFPDPQPPATRQPIFNLPPVVTGLIALLLAIHAGRYFLLDDKTDVQALLTFAFFPVRTTAPALFSGVAPDGAMVWSFLTYAALHADWGHVLVNTVWLAAFGAPLARRFGPVRFLAFAGVGAVAGAMLHLAMDPNSMTPMVGASAAVSALMAGAARFAFQRGGPMWGSGGTGDYQLPAAPLSEMVRDRRVMTFLGIWFAINLVFGLTSGAGMASGGVAWDAHIGGFLAGLLLFRLFDPVPRAS